MSGPGVISYPIPLYANVPIQPQNFKPKKFFIQNIVRGRNTLVETTVDMDYVVGQQIRLIIPPDFGIRELNNIQGYVIDIPASNQVIIDIDSLHMNSFILAVDPNQPQILAIGDIRSGAINSNGRISNKPYIPGSFRNISPQ